MLPSPALHDPPTSFTVLRNGPVPALDIDAFSDVHRRGRAELLAWLNAGADETLLDAPSMSRR